MPEPRDLQRMSDDPNRTVDEAAPDALDAGLAAAFAPDSGPPLPANDSVLKALGVVLPEVPHVQLREPPTEPITPVNLPRSPEMPTGPARSDPAGRLQILGEIARGGM